jgi:AraC-like DNA-binding protein
MAVIEHDGRCRLRDILHVQGREQPVSIEGQVELARRLLERGCGIAETAARTGFFDQSHLHRHFRRFGLSPKAYQQLVRAEAATAGWRGEP